MLLAVPIYPTGDTNTPMSARCENTYLGFVWEVEFGLVDLEGAAGMVAYAALREGKIASVGRSACQGSFRKDKVRSMTRLI